MKKILGIFIILTFFVSVSFGQKGSVDEIMGGNDTESQGGNQGGGKGGNGTNGTAEANGVTTNTTQTNEITTYVCTTQNCDGICQDNVCVENLYGDAGISIDKDCLLNGQCSMNVYETLGIRKSNPDPSVKVFAQDIILGASMFFGTIMTVLFIISGLSFVMAGYTGKSPDKAKKMMIGSIVGLLFVTFSYTIIRLIQFLATGGS